MKNTPQAFYLHNQSSSELHQADLASLPSLAAANLRLMTIAYSMGITLRTSDDLAEIDIVQMTDSSLGLPQLQQRRDQTFRSGGGEVDGLVKPVFACEECYETEEGGASQRAAPDPFKR